MIFTLWGLCFAISALGAWMIVAARKRRQATNKEGQQP
jgi:cytochrome c-type biogenesis protein CcmH/NrfF